MIPTIVLIIALCMIFYEKNRPGRTWPQVCNWWLRAAFFNLLQVGTIYLAGVSWDRWMIQHHHGLLSGLGSFWGGIVGYVSLTFIFYWWHRWRHASPFLWRWLHQMHHSPQRLEIVTAFYKHPFELISDSVLCSALFYLVLGLSPAAASGAILLSGLAELIYHWNVKTPHWIGYFFQRPESHCIHHQMGLHAYNYADLPLWDILFGTFRNPKNLKASCGLGEDEHRVKEMLLGKDITDKRKPESFLGPKGAERLATSLLLVLAVLQISADLFQQKEIKAVAAAWGASPCPKVFTSIEGIETFSSKYFLEWTDAQGDVQSLPLTPSVAKGLKGPYNRRNVYGALLSHGPILSKNEATRPAYESILNYAIGSNGSLLKEVLLESDSIEGDVTLVTQLKGESNG